MRPGSLVSWGASRPFRAFVLIVTLFLGATFHEWHHASEPHCDGDAQATEHACGCSVMHSAALAEPAHDPPAPAAIAWAVDAPATHAVPAAAAPSPAAPRAPPAA